MSGNSIGIASGINTIRWMLLVILLLSGRTGLKAQPVSNPVIDSARQEATGKFYTKAISIIDVFLAGKPKTFLDDAHYWKAYSFYHLKNYKAAEENYKLVLKYNTKYLPAYIDMGNMHMKQEKFEEAIYYFTAAIALNDTSIDLINSRGMCYYYSEKFELAIKDFKRVVKLDSTDYEAYNNVGSAEYNNQDIAHPHISDLKLALSYFNKSLELKPDFQLAIRNRGVIRYDLDSLEGAYKDLLYASQLDPMDYKSFYFLGKLLHKKKDFKVAIQFFDNAVRLAGNRPDVFMDRGRCKMDMGDFKGARGDFFKAMQLDMDEGRVEYEIARTYAAEDNMKETILALKEAKKQGLFKDTRYIAYLSKDKLFGKYYKNKEWQAAIYEIKFGKK